MTPITFERLEKAGFDRWNELFTYRTFPHPLNGNFRVDYKPDHGWSVFYTGGSYACVLRNVEFMEQVANFYKGICDKDMDFLKK